MPFLSHGVDIGRMSVTFNLDPLKLVPLELKYLAPGHSENLLLLLTMQPHQGKSVHDNSHEVTTEDIRGVHNGISRKLNDYWSLSVCLSLPYAAFAKITQCMWNRTLGCSCAWLQKMFGQPFLSSFV